VFISGKIKLLDDSAGGFLCAGPHMEVCCQGSVRAALRVGRKSSLLDYALFSVLRTLRGNFRTRADSITDNKARPSGGRKKFMRKQNLLMMKLLKCYHGRLIR